MYVLVEESITLYSIHYRIFWFYLQISPVNNLFLSSELSALVDQSWRMEMGGTLESEPLPI